LKRKKKVDPIVPLLYIYSIAPLAHAVHNSTYRSGDPLCVRKGAILIQCERQSGSRKGVGRGKDGLDIWICAIVSIGKVGHFEWKITFTAAAARS
jgi:hypothetical protein